MRAGCAGGPDAPGRRLDDGRDERRRPRDGDPGSDVLVYQDLFVAGDAGLSVGQQTQLGNLLKTADRTGFPIRVAIISSPSDLGAVTALWRKPQAYAKFLGYELSLAYKPASARRHAERLWLQLARPLPPPPRRHPLRRTVRKRRHLGCSRLQSPRSEAGRGLGRPARRIGGLSFRHVWRLGGAAVAGDRALAGVRRRRRAARPQPPGHGRRRHDRRRCRRRGPRPGGRCSSAGGTGSPGEPRTGCRGGRRDRSPRRAPAPAPAPARRPGGGRARSARGSRPGADGQDPGRIRRLRTGGAGQQPVPGSGHQAGDDAPDFTLVNQFGRPVSLHAFRGQVVLLAFTDSECTTICPMTTTAMLDAKAMLGAAGSHVALVGVDANPASTSIEDVSSYSQLHGMTHAWDFLDRHAAPAAPGLEGLRHRRGRRAGADLAYSGPAGDHAPGARGEDLRHPAVVLRRGPTGSDPRPGGVESAAGPPTGEHQPLLLDDQADHPGADGRLPGSGGGR